MKHRALDFIGGIITRHYFLVSLAILGLTVASLLLAAQLSINSNQIELLDQNLPPLQELKKITTLTGGNGFLFLALKGDDRAQLKQVADTLALRIEALDEIRHVAYRQEASFVLENIAMFIETEDLDEIRKRIRKKIKYEIRKENPFSIELVEPEEVVLTRGSFDDIIDKYRLIGGKKGIEDDYYISREDLQPPGDVKWLVLLLIKPVGESTDLEFTRALLQTLETDIIADYNRDNPSNAQLVEAYGPQTARQTADGRDLIFYGYTGNFKTNLDDSDTIIASLEPTSLIAFVGILLVLFYFLRRISFILIIEVGLLVGLLWTFAFAFLAVGQLNVITTMLAAILQGLGIDYGIHLLYRLREEYILTRDLKKSIHEAVIHSGSACLATAFTTSAAFFTLMLSRFGGFSEFGLIAGVGVLLIALATYVVVPVMFLMLEHFRPGFADQLLPRASEVVASEIRGLEHRRFPWARRIVLAAVVLTVVLGGLGSQISFNYDSRALMVPNQPSFLLQEEINARFEIASEPVAVYTEDWDDYRKLYQTLGYPIDKSRFPMVDEVMSVFRMLPDEEQQQANAKVLAKMRRDAGKVKDGTLAPEDQELFEQYLHYLGAEPFGLEDMPESLIYQFRPLPDVRDAWPGWLTFIYPRVALWDGEELLEFDRQVRVIEADDGTLFHATGIPIIYALLATIVLKDGQLCALVALGLVFVIVLLSFRKLSATLIALLPLVIGVVWMLGLMVVLGAQLNFINITVLTLIFGYGIDTGIHIYHRFVETGSVMRAVRMTGGAVLASMLTAIVAWGALMAADHQGLHSMGTLACLGIIAALVVSLTIVPAILQLVQDRSLRIGAGEEAEPADEQTADPAATV